MKTIYKYPLKNIDQQFIDLPKNRKILCVQTQLNCPCMWVMLDPEYKDIEPVSVNIYGKGNPISDTNQEYIGTYQLSNEWHSSLVFHVFEDKTPFIYK